MSKKILFCASTASHIKNFHLPYLKAFRDKGYEVWVATNKQEEIPYANSVVSLPIQKKFASFQNIKTIFEARKLMKEQCFDIISTHTTLASSIVRAAVLLLHKKPKVFCTVHGYLFNDNDGLRKWFYLLPEKICAPITNVLMVMNHEDYNIAQKHKLYKDKLYYINGMGIDLNKFKPVTPEDRISARKALGISKDDFVYVYAAEFSKRKNQEFLIRAFAEASKENPQMKLLLAGNGALLNHCKELTHQLQTDQILFLGYVKDMQQLYAACDVCVSSSLCEGLPFNIMEAMACGLPIIASDIKGHRELMNDGSNGILFTNKNELLQALAFFGSGNTPKSRLADMEKYGLKEVLKIIRNIYSL